jgi:hypothetical protein
MPPCQPAAETAVALPDMAATLPEELLSKVGRELVVNDPRCIGFLCQTCTTLLHIFTRPELKDAAVTNYRIQLYNPQRVGTLSLKQSRTRSRTTTLTICSRCSIQSR